MDADWWLDVARVVGAVLGGLGAVIAAVLAFVAIRQAGELQRERTRERTRERLQDRGRILGNAIETLAALEDAGYRGNDELVIARLQRRLLALASQTGARSSHDLTLVAKYDFHGTPDDRNELKHRCDATGQKIIVEIGELASQIRATFEDGAIEGVE